MPTFARHASQRKEIPRRGAARGTSPRGRTRPPPLRSRPRSTRAPTRYRRDGTGEKGARGRGPLTRAAQALRDDEAAAEVAPRSRRRRHEAMRGARRRRTAAGGAGVGAEVGAGCPRGRRHARSSGEPSSGAARQRGSARRPRGTAACGRRGAAPGAPQPVTSDTARGAQGAAAEHREHPIIRRF